MAERYGKRFAEAIRVLEEGLEDLLQFFPFRRLWHSKDFFYEYAGAFESRDTAK